MSVLCRAIMRPHWLERADRHGVALERLVSAVKRPLIQQYYFETLTLTR